MRGLTQGRAARVVARSELDFGSIDDPRRQAGVTFSLVGLLRLFVAAMTCGKQTLRAIENFARDLEPKVLRALGLCRPPADTTYYDLLSRLGPKGFRKVLWRMLRKDLDSKAITNDFFAGGVATFDGKGCGSGMGQAPNPTCRQSVCDDKGTQFWDVFALRVVLTSSCARPVLDQELIDGKHGEATTFGPMLKRVTKSFPALFRYITGDAGLASAHNAELVLLLGKVYMFMIKGNFKKLYSLAQKMLSDAAVILSTTERYQGYDVVREFRRVPAPPEVTFPGATQLWGVRQTRMSDDGKETTEDRVFVTCAQWDELSPERMLKLVRLHWGIENNANWTADMVFGEDTQCPCRSGESILVVSWLRVLAYNLVAVFRAHLPRRAGLLEAWERCRELIYQSWFLLGRGKAGAATSA